MGAADLALPVGRPPGRPVFVGSMIRTRRQSLRVTRKKLTGVRQRGVEVVTLHNGRLAVEVCPTRGMGILSARCGELFIGWQSPLPGVVHPRHVRAHARGGTGWLDGFTEFVARCGLRNIGRPGWDTTPAPDGGGRREFLTLHGPIANLPASDVTVSRSAMKISVRGTTRERTPTGDFDLATEISTTARSRVFRVTDVVTNRGASSASFQLLYHCNLGAPLLAAGATFLAPVKSNAGIDARSTRAIWSFDRYAGPTPGFQEQVFLLQLQSDAQGRTLAALVNAAGDAAVSIQFFLRELPCMTLWKQTGAPAERFVTGLEPGTSFPHHRSVERKHGRIVTLAPGQSRRFTLRFRVHQGRRAVAELRRRIDKLQRQPVRGS